MRGRYSRRTGSCAQKQFAHAVQTGQIPQSRWQTRHPQALAGGKALATQFKQDRKRRRVKALQRSGINDDLSAGVIVQAPQQRLQTGAGLRVHEFCRQGNHNQPFLALALLRSDSAVIRPSMPLALISWANWLR